MMAPKSEIRLSLLFANRVLDVELYKLQVIIPNTPIWRENRQLLDLESS